MFRIDGTVIQVAPDDHKLYEDYLFNHSLAAKVKSCFQTIYIYVCVCVCLCFLKRIFWNPVPTHLEVQVIQAEEKSQSKIPWRNRVI